MKDNRQIAVTKRTHPITMETEYTVDAHGTDLQVKVDKTGVLMERVRIRDAEELELFAIMLSKAWAQYLKVRPKIDIEQKIPSEYQGTLPGIV